MLKRLLCIVVGIIAVLSVSAQEKITIKINDQYESRIDSVLVVNSNTSTWYKTEKGGLVNITYNPTDPVVFSAPQHNTVTVPGTSLQPDMLVTLNKNFNWKDLVNPMFYIVYGGLWLLLFIVFAETGLFAGFFLPGDSLLFVAGIYSSNLSGQFFKSIGMADANSEWAGLFVLLALISVAGILGNTVGYWTGRKIGPSMYTWRDRWFYKKRYLHQAHEFYDKHGGLAIIGARFLPIIRTFAPIVAGIVGMEKKKFAYYNIVGCIAWVFSMLFAGHFLQKWILSQFGFDLKEHLEIIVLGIVVVTTAPVLIKLFFGKRKNPESIPPQTPE
jgi:membrane-associated protein